MAAGTTPGPSQIPAHMLLHQCVTNVIRPENDAVEAPADPVDNITTSHNQTVLEYRTGGQLYASLGTSKEKFSLFLAHSLRSKRPVDVSRITSRLVDLNSTSTRAAVLSLWSSQRLLSETRDPINVLRSSRSFAQLLDLYTSRVLAAGDVSSSRLLGFLRRHFPGDAVAECAFDASLPAEETLKRLKRLLVWFRQTFPYFYDRCESCKNAEGNLFVGYTAPRRQERAHRAERTELYHCGKCGAVSRFPRFNAVSKVLDTRRGRCGEYSVLAMRFLEALGYEVRWIVDWTDHVWAECLVGGRFVACDPCEAAVDEPLLYESWGKNLTVVIAFAKDEAVDVTATYTTDLAAAKKRRDLDEKDLEDLLKKATARLRGEAAPEPAAAAAAGGAANAQGAAGAAVRLKKPLRAAVAKAAAATAAAFTKAQPS